MLWLAIVYLISLLLIKKANLSKKYFVSCTKEDVCVEGGVCVGKPDHSLCDDENVCTTDTCEPSAEESCKNLALEDGEPCADDEPCTVSDQCLSGVCSGMEKVCDDGKECTLDSCDPDNGDCLHQPKSVGTLCNGGNKCTSGDTCDGNGSCLLGPVTVPPICKDNNPCTTDLCDPTVVEVNGNGGCKTTVLADNELCDDGDVCTNVDVCLSGQCVGTLLPNPGVDSYRAASTSNWDWLDDCRSRRRRVPRRP